MTSHRVLAVLAAALFCSGTALAQQAPTDPNAPPEAQTIAAKDLSKDDVRKIQSALNEAGYNAGAVDGIWGSATRQALSDFQKAKGLDASGQLNDDTLLALGFGRNEFAAARPLKASDVRQVQEALNKQGYNVGSVDGKWGPATESALRNFQNAKGLDPTGKLNRDTVLALGLPVTEFAAGEFADEAPKSQ